MYYNTAIHQINECVKAQDVQLLAEVYLKILQKMCGMHSQA